MNLFAGRYELEERYSKSVISTVWKSHDTEQGRQVAVQILSPALSKDARFADNFETQARLAQALNHPNVLAVLDRGIEERGLYLVTEWFPGETLEERMGDRPGLGLATARLLADDAGIALTHAHSIGITHGNLSPSSVVFGAAGGTKVSGFGMSMPIHALERAGVEDIPKSLAYCTSPEVANEMRPTPAGDVYSLGCLVMYCMTGRPPFSGGSAAELLRSHRTENPRLDAISSTSTPPGVKAAITKALEKDPLSRQRSVDEFVETVTGSPMVSPRPAQGDRQPSKRDPLTAKQLVRIAGLALAIAVIVLAGAVGLHDLTAGSAKGGSVGSGNPSQGSMSQGVSGQPRGMTGASPSGSGSSPSGGSGGVNHGGGASGSPSGSGGMKGNSGTSTSAAGAFNAMAATTDLKALGYQALNSQEEAGQPGPFRLVIGICLSSTGAAVPDCFKAFPFVNNAMQGPTTSKNVLGVTITSQTPESATLTYRQCPSSSTESTAGGSAGSCTYPDVTDQYTWTGSQILSDGLVLLVYSPYQG